MARRTRQLAADPTDMIDRSNPKHVAFLNQQKHMFSEASDYFVRETNETERALCAQLMLVDTVLITGSLVVISSNDLLPQLSDPLKFLLLFALLYLLISIACGITYYFKVRRYNLNWAKAKHEAMKHFLDESIVSWKVLRRKTNKEQTAIPEELDSFWLRIQIYFMCAASLYYLVAFFGLLYNVYDLLT